jgi:O-antigen ligase
MNARAVAASTRVPIGACWLLALPLALAGLVDLPRGLQVGSVTLLGGLTILQAALAVAALSATRAYPRRLLLLWLPYAAFLAWMVVRSGTMLAHQGAVQHALVYAVFGLHVLLAGTFAAIRPPAAVAAVAVGMTVMDVLAVGLAAIAIVSGNWIVGPRAVALLATIATAWHVAGWYHGRRWAGLRTLVWLAVVVASLSRMALAIVLILTAIVIILQFASGASRFARLLPALAAATVVLAAVAASLGPVLYERFFEGYTNVEVGGVTVSTSGRSEFWPVVYESAWRHPILGGGLGSSQAALMEFDPEVIGHPHNEYLRVWHDGGVIGAALLFSGLFAWTVRLGRSWRAAVTRRAPHAAVEGAAFLMLVGLLLGAITDNGFDYIFLMSPAGIITGLALGFRLLGRDDPPPTPASAPMVPMLGDAMVAGR